MGNCKGGKIMTLENNVKTVKEKIEEAMNKSKETGKGYGFNICSKEKEITTTELQEGDGMTTKNSCSGTEIGSFHIHPGSKDEIPSQKDTIQPEVQKI
jgi:hypothetical protein